MRVWILNLVFKFWFWFLFENNILSELLFFWPFFGTLWLATLTYHWVPSAWQWKQRRAWEAVPWTRNWEKFCSEPVSPSSWWPSGSLFQFPLTLTGARQKLRSASKQEQKKDTPKGKGKETPRVQVAMHHGCQVGLIKLPRWTKKSGRMINALLFVTVFLTWK